MIFEPENICETNAIKNNSEGNGRDINLHEISDIAKPR